MKRLLFFFFFFLHVAFDEWRIISTRSISALQWSHLRFGQTPTVKQECFIKKPETLGREKPCQISFINKNECLWLFYFLYLKCWVLCFIQACDQTCHSSWLVAKTFSFSWTEWNDQVRLNTLPAIIRSLYIFSLLDKPFGPPLSLLCESDFSLTLTAKEPWSLF